MTEVDLLTFSMRTEPPKASDADWFRIVHAKGKAEATKVYIYDEIGFWGTSAKDFAAQLNEIDSNEIELHLNSPGGSVFDGLAIMAAIKNHKAHVKAIVDGLAASAASFILQAADERFTTRNAQIMIHDAKAYAGGNAEQMRKAAELLDRVSDNIADIYAVRSGQGTVDSWRAIMRAGDEWYSGNEALDAGLVDAVIDNPEEDEDAPDEASNSWSAAEVEAFLQSATEGLAASTKNLTIKNRVQEDQMTDKPTNSTVTPPVVPTPPAPTAPEASGVPAFVMKCNGEDVTDFAAVQAHIVALETFKSETITEGRKSFVASLVKGNKIMGDKDTVASTEEFALSLTNEQFDKWKATMSSAPANSLFGNHGATVGDKSAPQNGGNADAAQRAQKIKNLQDIVDAHRASGMTEESLKNKDSYKELQALMAQTTGN